MGTKATSSLSKQIIKHQEDIARLIMLYNDTMTPALPLTVSNVRARLKTDSVDCKYGAMTQWCLKKRADEELEYVQQEKAGALEWALHETIKFRDMLSRCSEDEKFHWGGMLEDSIKRYEAWHSVFSRII